MDSQGTKPGTLVGDPIRLKQFAPGRPLEGRLVFLDPDPAHPLALNLFDFGLDKTEAMTERERRAYLTSVIDLAEFIYPLIGGKSRRRFIERLGVLYHEGGYVNRPARQWQAVNARYMPAVYELGEAGEIALIERGLAADRSPVLHRGRGHGVLFHHELMVSDILSSIEIGIRARDDLRFVSWQEILDKAPRSTRDAADPFEIPVTVTYNFSQRTEIYRKPIRPDAVFGIEYQDDEKKRSKPIARTNRSIAAPWSRPRTCGSSCSIARCYVPAPTARIWAFRTSRC